MNLYIEALGILAMLVTLFSFLLNGEKKIRRVNIIGSALFVIYGILINSISVGLLNFCLILVHMYKLYKLEKSSRYLEARLKTVFTHDNRQIHTISKEEIHK
jgi:uncharacterized protein with PQ loop repeat